MAYGSVSVDSSVTSWGDTTAGLYGFKNRIINGAMMIDQRAAGNAVTVTSNLGYFSCDRYTSISSQPSKFSMQQTTTAPAGFSNSLKCAVVSAYTPVSSEGFGFIQIIEGYNVADLNWGTANAKAVTVSFQVQSSVTGTYSFFLMNSANNRSYPVSYTISSANTWTTVSATIPGDTTGTWLTTNGSGLWVGFILSAASGGLGPSGAWAGASYYGATGTNTTWSATSGATFYITGVQLEKGTTATSFDVRPYGTELSLCQRYYETSASAGTAPADGVYSFASSGANANSIGGLWYSYHWITFKVNKRISTPTMTFYGSSGNLQWLNNGSWTTLSSVSIPTGDSTAVQSDNGVTFRAGTTGSQYNAIYVRGTWTASAEL